MRDHPMKSSWGRVCPTDTAEARRADIASQVGQGPLFPTGSARFRGFTLSCRSPASHLGSWLLPHDAFQEHAAHPVEWATKLNSKGSERTCRRSGLATFLPCACTAHSDFVVDSCPHMVRAAQPLISRWYTTRGRKTGH